MNVQTFFLVLSLLCNLQHSKCTDFTHSAFGTNTDHLFPAAFGDFNSDELTDMFVIKNTDKVHLVQILLGSLKEPYFSLNPRLSCSHDGKVTSVVPGDYDGDGLMDVLTTVERSPYIFDVYVHWGRYDGECLLNCTTKRLLQSLDEPLAITYRTDLRTDILAVDREDHDSLTIFRLSKDRRSEKRALSSNNSMKNPHSHAFLDINEDNYADLVLTTNQRCEVWTYAEDKNSFLFDESLSFLYPFDLSGYKKPRDLFGQFSFIDLESKESDKMYIVAPIIEEPAIYVYSFEFKKWFNLNINFEDSLKNKWSFPKAIKNWYFSKDPLQYMDVPTLRAGDFNNDGFVDLLATLQHGDEIRTFLLENSACTDSSCELNRTFVVRWTDLSPNNENAVMGVFFDFMQDGILDVIFVQYDKKADKYSLSAYKNSLDYDANFIKVMVISGIDNTSVQIPASSILGKKRSFGSNLPGPRIRYQTTNQDGVPQYGRTHQLAQSAHFALNLPYTIFGLGRSPNFVEDLTISMFNRTKQISPIIPNSQIVIRIPNTAATDTSKWRAQLFVTPSKIIWQTVFALTGTCIVLAVIIGVLHWKERREDKMERLQESQRGFHFDAM